MPEKKAFHVLPGPRPGAPDMNFCEYFNTCFEIVDDRCLDVVEHLHVYRFEGPWFDTVAIQRLGGAERVAVSVGEVLSLLYKYPLPEDSLHNNTHASVFYVKNKAGELKAVTASWDEGPRAKLEVFPRWDVWAHPDLCRPRAGSREPTASAWSEKVQLICP